MNKIEKMKVAVKECAFQCLIPVLMFFLIGPINLYLGNMEDFPFSITDILPLILLCSVCCFLILLLICCFIKRKKPRSIVSAIILGVGIGFYVQSNFMVGGYGQLNGQEIDWESMIGRGIVNTIIWSVCILIPVMTAIASKKGKRFVVQKAIAQLMSIFLLLTLGITFFSVDKSNKKNEEAYTVSTDEAFTLSKEKNVVVFLLDNFSSMLFEEIITEDASYQDKFDGFTYFPDTSGIGCTTKGSLPFILTGLWNENSMPYKEYLNTGYDNELYKLLNDLNYDTRLFMGQKYIGEKHIELFDNMYREKADVAKIPTTAMMYKLTAFTHMPHFLKPLFWLYTGDFNVAVQSTESSIKLAPDPQFYKSLLKNGITINENYEGAYRFYYLDGAHSPFNMNENAEAVESGSVSMKQRAKGALKIVYSYLEQLKNKQVYENTMVVVLADHGNWEEGDVFNPMLLIKPFDAKFNKLNVVNSQISYEDLMPTLIEAVSEKNVGTTIFEIPEDKDRERRFLYYDWDGDWDADYLPPLYEYSIKGNIRDLSSRRMTGRVYTADGLIENPVEYTLGEHILYNIDNQGKNTFVDYGLYSPEESHTYTKGYVQWVFPLKDYNGSELRFTLNVAATTGGKQRIKVSVNGEMIDEIDFYTGGELGVDIPPGLIGENNEVSIRMDFPEASSSEGDKRVRALAIKSAVLDYIIEEKYKLGTEIAYNATYVGEKFVYEGTHVPENGHTYTKDYRTKWLFPLESYEQGDLKFSLEIVDVRANNQQVHFLVNDTIVDTMVITKSGVYDFIIPEELVVDDQVKIQMEFPDASNTEQDVRVRSLAIKSVLLDYLE